MSGASPEHPVRIAVLGAGGRGHDAYGEWILDHPEAATIAAVADISPHRRDALADRAGLKGGARFDSWSALLDRSGELGLDAVIVALPDTQHVEPALRAAGLGLPTLLEKPVAVSTEALQRLTEASAGLEGLITVAHVLRYTPFWRTIADILANGAIGTLTTINLEENIGFWHFAHSYVRGNWRRTDLSSPVVLAKTCHDLDLIRWLAGEAPERVSSLGSLTYFRELNAPAGAPAYCLEGCPAQDVCAFYAPRYYVEALADRQGWPVALLGEDMTPEGRLTALRDSPYGRCVFRSDNDVPDHQQTLLSFPSGLTATLSMSALTGENTRTVHLTGTEGEVSGHLASGAIEVDLFSPHGALGPLPQAEVGKSSTRWPLGHRHLEVQARAVEKLDGDHRGHVGGDAGLMAAFVAAVAAPTPADAVGTALLSALDSHWMAFAAEESRLSGRTVEWAAYRRGG